jgi:colanic acid/amylovoran biosynthesis glycosyltransferase
MLITDKKSNRTLLLFTDRFPYGTHEEFIESEIPILAERFSRVIIVPSRKFPAVRPLPKDVQVEDAYSIKRSQGFFRVLNSIRLSLTSDFFYREMLNQWRATLHPLGLKRLMSHVEQAAGMYRWLQVYTLESNIQLDQTLFYSYWFSQWTTAIALLKQKYPEIKLISRVHGGDVYEERYTPPYLPFRKFVINQLDYLFTVSEDAREYLASRYPQIANRIEVSRLGTPDPKFETQPSQDSVLRIVSCSYLKPIKRLDLLIEGLAFLARQNPLLKIEWHHLGSGELRHELEMLAKKCLPLSVSWYFHGQLTNPQVLDFYRTHPLDVFVNVSSSEGIPVSIMEAQSCAIPVVATAVGGTPEIVNESNGILLPPNPSPEAIASALSLFAFDPTETKFKRENSRQNWHDHYYGEKNFHAFIDRLNELFR